MDFKVYYHKLFVHFVSTKIEECITATDVVKSLPLLHAVTWISQGWIQLIQEVIKKCFKRTTS